MIVLKYANLALAFLLELCALAALGYWGFVTGGGYQRRLASASGCRCWRGRLTTGRLTWASRA